MVTPHPGLDRVSPLSGWDEVPPHRDWLGYPLPPLRLDGVPSSPIERQSSIASTCYMAGGMPRAFTQGDFLLRYEVYSMLTKDQLDHIGALEIIHF